jgi:hypothetical protein
MKLGTGALYFSSNLICLHQIFYVIKKATRQRSPQTLSFGLVCPGEVLLDGHIPVGILQHPRLRHPLVPVLVPSVVMNKILGNSILHLHLDSGTAFIVKSSQSNTGKYPPTAYTP